MINCLLCCLALLLTAGCGRSHQDSQDVVAKVGPYVITRQEFQEAYKNSSYGSQNTVASHRTFLNNMINQKLILLDAINKGMDKNRGFLNMIENFWQQSLITADLQEKSREGGNLEAWLEYLKENTKIDINQESLQ